MASQNMMVCFGSETGTAEDYANRIKMECRRHRMHVTLLPLDDVDLETLAGTELLCVSVSTTGQGEEPSNMQSFWKKLRQKGLPSNFLSNVNFGILAFGDSSYSKYNFAGKKLYRRLIQLGARPLCDLGLCDDQHDFGAEGSASPWIDDFFKVLREKYLPSDASVIPSDEILPSTYIAKPSVETTEFMTDEGRSDGFFTVALTGNDRITAKTHFQDTRLLSFRLPDSITYNPGDVALIYPENSTEYQEGFLNMTDMNPDDVFSLTPRESGDSLPNRLPRICSVRYLVAKYWDLHCCPGVNFIRQLAKHATDELEREKLLEFTTMEGQDDFIDYCTRPKRSVYELLQDFHKTAKAVPLEHWLDIMPKIKPRSFSIASCMEKHSRTLQLLVAVVRYKTRLSKERLGLCSNYLANLELGSELQLAIKSGSIRVPKENVPCIFVAPGTGIAPFRSIIWNRALSGHEENLLFFGFRSRKADFYFESEWDKLQDNYGLKMYLAPSRDQTTKLYVQHLIHDRAIDVRNLVLNGAYVFVAGNSKDMPDAVRKAVVDALSADIGDKAEAFVDGMERVGRLQFETWS